MQKVPLQSTDLRPPRLAGGAHVGRQPSLHPHLWQGRLQWLATELTWSSHAVHCRPSTLSLVRGACLCPDACSRTTCVHTVPHVEVHQGQCCSSHTESGQVPA